jgi:hypothetical protein
MRHGQGNGWLARVGDFIDFSFCRIKEEQEWEGKEDGLMNMQDW